MIKFTKEEDAYIDICFQMTKVHYIDDPKKRDDVNHIREVLHHRDKYMGYIGRRGHELMWSIYAKMGYCQDGLTTVEERKIQIAFEKQQEDERIAREKKKLIAKLDAQIAKLIQMKKDIVGEEQEHKVKMTEQKKIRDANFKQYSKNQRDTSFNNLKIKIGKELEEMTVPELKEIAKFKKIKNYSKMRKAELKTAIGDV